MNEDIDDILKENGFSFLTFNDTKKSYFNGHNLLTVYANKSQDSDPETRQAERQLKQGQNLSLLSQYFNNKTFASSLPYQYWGADNRFINNLCELALML